MDSIAKTQQKREQELKDDITKDLKSTSALCCKRIFRILACPLREARVSGVPASDSASTSAPLERRNFTISGYPEEKKNKRLTITDT